MRAILEENPEAVRVAGETLVRIADHLRAGRAAEALAMLEAAEAGYPEWDDLDRAIGDVEEEIERRQKATAVCDVVVRLVKMGVGAALKGGLPL